MDMPRQLKDGLQLMSTTARHSEIVDFLTGRLLARKIKGELNYWSDTVPLVYDDDRKLLNVNDYTLAQANHLAPTLTRYRYVAPDVMVFCHNAFISNPAGTRHAGCPDLVVEVWSDYNTAAERRNKFEIYASSPLTEHWYMEQGSDLVTCYLGEKRLPDQHLRQVLMSQNGLDFDLTYLWTGAEESWNEFIKYSYKGDDDNGHIAQTHGDHGPA